MSERDEKIAAAQAEYAKLSRAAYEMSLTPNGKLVFDRMMSLFDEQTTIRKSGKATDPGPVDPYASIAAAGGREVCVWLKELIKVGSRAPVQVAQGNAQEVANG